jgi:hypothetical protein
MRTVWAAVALAATAALAAACGDDDGAGAGGAAGAPGVGGAAGAPGAGGAAGAPGAGGAAGAPAAAPDLTGAWASACVAPEQGSPFTLAFDIGRDAWALDYRVYGDPGCRAPLFVVRIEGPYELTGPSAAVPGAYEGRFGFTKKTITPLAASAVDFLQSANGCGGEGWAENVATDVAGGCPNLGQYPLADCGADYDLVERRGDELRFGNRPADNDMCTPDERPTALGPLVLRRAP